jgi:hypothetical protein
VDWLNGFGALAGSREGSILMAGPGYETSSSSETLQHFDAIGVAHNDAEAMAEAARSAGLHRVRARLVSRRTATINQIRSFLIELGIAVRPAPMHCAIRFSRS